MLTATYTPQQAISLVTQFVHGAPITGVEANLCDMVNSYIWLYYPWSWTLTQLTPIPLVDGVQDYTPVNTNIGRFTRVRLVRTDVTPNEARELAMLADLGVELTRKGGIDSNTSFGYFAGLNIIRLMLAASVGQGQTIQIQGEFVAAPTRITDATMNTVFAFPDQYFNAFVEGLKWKIYQLTDDPRAGGVQVVKNGKFEQVFTGQFGMFIQCLNYAARNEDMSRGDQFQYPESGMGTGRASWPGIYGV